MWKDRVCFRSNLMSNVLVGSVVLSNVLLFLCVDMGKELLMYLLCALRVFSTHVEASSLSSIGGCKEWSDWGA